MNVMLGSDLGRLFNFFSTAKINFFFGVFFFFLSFHLAHKIRVHTIFHILLKVQALFSHVIRRDISTKYFVIHTYPLQNTTRNI